VAQTVLARYWPAAQTRGERRQRQNPEFVHGINDEFKELK
jgi:hypothetical protein